jgi:hypothetical protein
MKRRLDFTEWFKQQHYKISTEKEKAFTIVDMYNAYKAHDEELKKLKNFEKQFRKLQEKLRENDDKRWKDITNFKYEERYLEAIEELEYL